jgi:SAM-dependent methyltransferase
LLNLKPGAVVLEPSAGLGRILDALQPLLPSSVTAIEISSKCTGELFKQDRAGVKILQRDFLDVSPEETGLFDAVVMNPPFHVRSDIKHIQHALKFLRPGGRLASVCMDTHHRDEVLRPISKEWIKLPRGSFHESGTDIATVLLMIETQ